MKLKNISLKKKIILIFIICVLVPLVSTNGFIIWTMQQKMDSEKQRQIENIADRVENELERNVENLTSVMDNLYMDEKLDSFLKKKYYNEVDYYSAYRALMEDNRIHYYYTSQSIYNIVIATKNDSITNGTYFLKYGDVENSSWIQKFENSNQKVLLYAYYEDGKNSSGYIERIRHIAILRKLDYFDENSSNIIMIDLDYEELRNEILEECTNMECMVTEGEQILFSTQEQNCLRTPFMETEQQTALDIFDVQEMNKYGADWNITVSAEKNDLFSIISQFQGAFFIIYIINMLLPSLIVYLVYRSLVDRIYITERYLKKVENGDYEEMEGNHGTDEIGHLMDSYNLMVVKIKNLIEDVFKTKERQQSLEISKKQAELNALQSQINPHFMFNALESIRMHSILKSETETAKILESFAILMRKNIQWNKDRVTIEEECDNISRYLQIQKYRFGNRLEFSVHVQEECKERKIPKFILMTFVENACVHGIEQSVEGGSITVMVSEDDSSLYFEIMDSGHGMEEEELEHLRYRIEHADIQDIQEAKQSIGILNTVVRMNQYYQDNVRIEINSTLREGTEICVVVPKG